MKLKYLFCIAASALMLASCEKDFSAETETGISIESVRLRDYNASMDVRSSYTDSYATKFETGDRLGLVIIENGVQTKNAAFAYTEGTGWKAETSVPYTESISGIIAYYPYNENLSSDIVTAAALKDAVEIKADQSVAEDFKNMDLLVAELVPAAELNIELSHAFSMISLDSKSTVTAGEETFTYNVEISDVSVTIGDVRYVPYQNNGTYVCLVKDGTSLKRNGFRYIYTLMGEATVKTVNNEISLLAGRKYSFPCTAAGSSGNAVAAGDFFCVSSASGNIVIIPSVATAIPDGLDCKGIVFNAMDAAQFTEFATVNGLSEADYSGFDGSHGLVISLKRGASFGTATSESIYECCGNVENYDNVDVSNGYALTKALSASSALSANMIELFKNHTSETINNTTGWYLPSFNEVKYIIRGENYGTISDDGKELLNKQLNKVNGEEVSGNIPTVTMDTPTTSFRCFAADGNGQVWAGVPGEAWYVICAF